MNMKVALRTAVAMKHHLERYFAETTLNAMAESHTHGKPHGVNADDRPRGEKK
jgi:hypothetical protein